MVWLPPSLPMHCTFLQIYFRCDTVIHPPSGQKVPPLLQ